MSVKEVLSKTRVPLQSWSSARAKVTSSLGKKRSLEDVPLDLRSCDRLRWMLERPFDRVRPLLLPLALDLDRSESGFGSEGSVVSRRIRKDGACLVTWILVILSL